MRGLSLFSFKKWIFNFLVGWSDNFGRSMISNCINSIQGAENKVTFASLGSLRNEGLGNSVYASLLNTGNVRSINKNLVSEVTHHLVA